jgi:hypothetical protein
MGNEEGRWLKDRTFKSTPGIASWSSFLGQPSLHPQGIGSIEELAKMVTQMVIQSFNSISSSSNNNNNYNMQQSQPQM